MRFTGENLEQEIQMLIIQVRNGLEDVESEGEQIVLRYKF